MDSDLLAELAAEACDDRKAKDIKLIKVDKVSSIADWLVIAGAQSEVQVRAIVKSVEDRLFSELNRSPLRKEGVNEAKWALLDYGELIVHILQTHERNFYDLESFWNNGMTKQFSLPTENIDK